MAVKNSLVKPGGKKVPFTVQLQSKSYQNAIGKAFGRLALKMASLPFRYAHKHYYTIIGIICQYAL